MAIPDFTSSIGLALMRQAPDSEWFFVCWVTGSSQVALEVLGSGTHRFELWEVIGATSGTATAVSYDGPVRLGIIQMHK